VRAEINTNLVCRLGVKFMWNVVESRVAGWQKSTAVDTRLFEGEIRPSSESLSGPGSVKGRFSLATEGFPAHSGFLSEKPT
jgi:hypothetical protein